jgi:transcriptional regulator with XRE-family HTH domain
LSRPRNKQDVDAKLAVSLFRSFKDWDQGELARAARIAPSQLSVYLRGERAIPREVLERVADAAEFPRYLLAPLLRAIRSFRAAAQGLSRPERALEDVFLAGVLDLCRTATEAVQRILQKEPREDMEELWERMAHRPLNEQVAIVEEAEELQNQAFHNLLTAESAAAAADDPEKARELAELARRVAELIPSGCTARPV